MFTNHSSSKDLLVLKEAALRDEELHVVIDGEDHELPVNDVEDFTLGCNDQVAIVPVAHLVVQSVSARVLYLQVLGRNEEADERDEHRVVLFILRQLGGVDVHQMNGVVNRLVVTLQGVSNIAEVVYSLDSFHHIMWMWIKRG